MDGGQTTEISQAWPSKSQASVRMMCGIKSHDMNCGFKAYDTDLAKSLNLYGDMHRYTPVLGKMNGAKITEIAINHRPRLHGKSKYGTKRLMRGFFDLITISFLMAFLERPMHLFGKVGGLSTAGSAICSYLVFIKYAYGEGIGDRPLLSLGVLLIIIGVQFFLLGLLGETITYRASENNSNTSSSKNFDYSSSSSSEDIIVKPNTKAMISMRTFNVLERMATIPAIPPLKNNERLNVNTPSLAPSPAGKKESKEANEPCNCE